MNTLKNSGNTSDLVTIDGIGYTVYNSHVISYNGSDMNVYVGLYENGSELKLILLLLQPEVVSQLAEHIIAVDLEMNSNNNCWVSKNTIRWSNMHSVVDSINDVSNLVSNPVYGFNIKYCVSDI